MKVPVSDVDFYPSPDELASFIAGLGDYEQARFISLLATKMQPEQWAMQLEYISQSPELTNDGRWLMNMIGDYAQHNRRTG